MSLLKSKWELPKTNPGKGLGRLRTKEKRLDHYWIQPVIGLISMELSDLVDSILLLGSSKKMLNVAKAKISQKRSSLDIFD